MGTVFCVSAPDAGPAGWFCIRQLAQSNQLGCTLITQIKGFKMLSEHPEETDQFRFKPSAARCGASSLQQTREPFFLDQWLWRGCLAVDCVADAVAAGVAGAQARGFCRCSLSPPLSLFCSGTILPSALPPCLSLPLVVPPRKKVSL
jgi:hypothetical protein